jgi:hypothetical protein
MNMSKIVELKTEQTDKVAGGVKTVSANTSSAQLSVSSSTATWTSSATIQTTNTAVASTKRFDI